MRTDLLTLRSNNTYLYLQHEWYTLHVIAVFASSTLRLLCRFPSLFVFHGPRSVGLFVGPTKSSETSGSISSSMAHSVCIRRFASQRFTFAPEYFVAFRSSTVSLSYHLESDSCTDGASNESDSCSTISRFLYLSDSYATIARVQPFKSNWIYIVWLSPIHIILSKFSSTF